MQHNKLLILDTFHPTPLTNGTLMRLELAEIGIEIEPEQASDTIRLEEWYAPFMSNRDPEITIRLVRSSMPAIFPRAADMVFESADMWSLFRIDGRNCLVQRHATSHAIPERILVSNADFRCGELFVRMPSNAAGVMEELPNPLDYPLGQVLMLCYLAQGRGLMVHACGIEHEGKGYLFAGNSGHGKSTLAELWRDTGRVLTDERVILRLHGNEVWMYGTPWHGDFKGASPGGVRLDRVFFLQQGGETHAEPTIGVESSALLLARSFPPLWDKEEMAFTLGFLSQVTSQASCFRLSFVPDRSVVAFVTCLK